jgi:catechol 2,3-dioxygenase-like lactoylglutathione lyase family enzyme
MPGVSLKLLVLKTPQMDRLRTFYHSLGVELVEEKHREGPVHYAGKIGDAVLEIYPLVDEGGTADATTRLGFAVDRLVEVVEALREGGTVIASEPRQTAWGLRAVVRDPDGRAVELYQA